MIEDQELTIDNERADVFENDLVDQNFKRDHKIVMKKRDAKLFEKNELK